MQCRIEMVGSESELSLLIYIYIFPTQGRRGQVGQGGEAQVQGGAEEGRGHHERGGHDGAEE